MKEKILVLGIYPAPYRLEICQSIVREFQADIFFEYKNGDERDERWFQTGEYQLLDDLVGRANYQRACNNLRQYDLVVLYDYATKEGRKLIKRCQREKVPYIVNCDGVILPHRKNFIKDFVKTRLLSKATAYLASGEHAEEYFLRYGAKEEKIHIHHFSALHNYEILSKPLAFEDKQKLRIKLGLPQDKKIAIAVGRFIPLKRYDHLLSVWNAVDDQCCLLLIGGGSEYERYQEIIRGNGLKNVILEKFHPAQELYEYYKASDVFIHPSSYDVWGLVVNEAMANGLPVIVSDTCIAGLELVREGENGYIFPMGNENVAIDKLLMLLSDDNLRQCMAAEGLKTIQEYTIENMAKTHLDVFEKVLKQYE